jgi:hypothetical protein
VITTFVLHLLLVVTVLPILVAPLAVYGLRELAPASQPHRTFALAGGGRR